MQIKKQVGVLIQNQRKSKGLRQEDLAAKSGLSRSYICDIENGRYAPSVETLFKISGALGVQAVELLPRESEG